MQTASRSFADLVREAIADFSENGYDSEQRLEVWLDRLRDAAEAELMPEAEMQTQLRRTLETIYGRLIDRGEILSRFPGVSKFTLQNVRPELRDELARRIMANANLIKLNRRRAVEETLQRFAGWATSVPAGGAAPGQARKAAATVRRAVTGLPFIERRVSIDQGHKFAAALAATLARGSNALAMRWRQHYTRYPRHTHKLRDGRVYLIRGSWAQEAGLVRPQEGSGYLDEITQPGEEVYCFPGDSPVQFADGVEVGYRRWYSGELTEVVTASGKLFCATPNHPILTTNGWVSVGLLDESHEIIEIADDGVGLGRSEIDNDQAVSTISEVFSALQVDGVTQQRWGRAEQFHGDGTDCNIDVVFAARPLRVGCKSGIMESVFQGGFTKTNDPAADGGYFHGLFGRAFSAFGGLVCSFKHVCFLLCTGEFPSLPHSVATDLACCGVGVGSKSFPLFNRGIAVPGFGGVAPGSEWYTGQFQPVLDNVPGGTQRATDLVTTLPAKVHPYYQSDINGILSSFGFGDKSTAFRIVRVKTTRKQIYSGHVFNLQTRTGFYISCGIVAHNCRCTGTYLTTLRQLPEDMLTAKGREELARVRREIAA